MADEVLTLEKPVDQGQQADAKPDAVAAPAAETKSVDWREDIQNEDARKYAAQFTTKEAFALDGLNKRKQLSTAIIPPSKDATPEQIAEYDKRIGVPDAYEWTKPADRDFNDTDKALQDKAAKAMKAAKFTVTQQKAVEGLWTEMQADMQKQASDAAKAKWQADETALRNDWGSDFDTNHKIAAAAWGKLGGNQGIEDLRLADGGRLGDHPAMVKIFAEVGRLTMESDKLVGVASTDRNSLEQTHRDVIKKRAEAVARGDNAEATRLDHESMRIAARLTPG